MGIVMWFRSNALQCPADNLHGPSVYNKGVNVQHLVQYLGVSVFEVIGTLLNDQQWSMSCGIHDKFLLHIMHVLPISSNIREM